MTSAASRRHERAWRNGLVALTLVATAVPVAIQTIASAPPAAAVAPAGTTTLVSQRQPSTPPPTSRTPAASADGRWIAFVTADALVPEDDNGFDDVYVWDTALSTATLISRPSVGSVGNAPSNGGSDGDGTSGERGVQWDPPAISSDGRYVAFASMATNLIPTLDPAGQDFKQIYVVDRRSSPTGPFDVAPFITIASATGPLQDPPAPGPTTTETSFPVSFREPGNGDSRSPSISDGQFHPIVAFASEADNLVPGDTNGVQDVFTWTTNGEDNFVTMASRVASVDANRTPLYALPDGPSRAPQLSADGQELVFASDATNLVDNIKAWGGTGDAFPGDQQADDTNDATDVFMTFPQTAFPPSQPTAPSTLSVLQTVDQYVFPIVFKNDTLLPVHFGTVCFVVDNCEADAFYFHVATTGPSSTSADFCSDRVVPAGGTCSVWLDFSNPVHEGDVYTGTLRMTVPGFSTFFDVPFAVQTGTDGNVDSSVVTEDEYQPGELLQSNTSEFRGITLVSRNQVIESGCPSLPCTNFTNAQGLGASTEPVITVSSSVAYVAFTSASSFSSVDDNNLTDIYAADVSLPFKVVLGSGTALVGGGTLDGSQRPLISWLMSGDGFTIGDGASRAPSIAPANVNSEPGRWVAFATQASNLVVGQDSPSIQILLHDRDANDSGVLDVLAPEAMNNYYVSLQCDTPDCSVATAGNAPSGAPSLVDLTVSRLGGTAPMVAFDTTADNLAPPDTNGADVDVLYTKPGTSAAAPQLLRVLGGSGLGVAHEPSINADGRYVAFSSASGDLVPGDTNNVSDIFVRDTLTSSTVRVSVFDDGTQPNNASSQPSISADGRYVAFATSENFDRSDDNGYSDIYVHDRDVSGSGVFDTPGNIENRWMSFPIEGQSNGNSSEPDISADGRWVAFTSEADNLARVAVDVVPQVYLSGPVGDENDVRLISQQDIIPCNTSFCEPAAANGPSSEPTISATGTYVAFTSTATNLLDIDDSNNRDVYRANTSNGDLDLVSTGAGAGESLQPSIDDDGGIVAFTSSGDVAPTARPAPFLSSDLDAYLITFAGGIATMSFTLGNGPTATAPFVVGSTVFGGLSAGLSVASTTCTPGVSIAPGVSAGCSITVQFGPTGVTPTRVPYIRVLGSDPAFYAQQSIVTQSKSPIEFVGPSSGPITSYDFGYQLIGSTSAVTFMDIVNISPSTVTITAVNLPGGDFVVEPGTVLCVGDLPPGESCSAGGFSFQPSAPAGDKSGTLSVDITADTDAAFLDMTGQAIDPLRLTGLEGETSLGFGQVYVGSSRSISAIFVNETASTVAITSIDLSTASGTDFSIPSTDCFSYDVGPNGFCIFDVDFTPLSVGDQTNVLNVNAGGNLYALPLQGTGIIAQTSRFEIPFTVPPFFPPQPVGTTSQYQRFEVQSGPSTISFTASVTGDFAFIDPVLDFTCESVSPTSVGVTELGPDSFCYIYVTFTPTAAGDRTGTVTIDVNTTDTDPTLSDTLFVDLTGTGILPFTVDLDPSTDLGDANAGGIGGSSTVRVTNNLPYGDGQNNLLITSISIDNTADFDLLDAPATVDGGCDDNEVPEPQPSSTGPQPSCLAAAVRFTPAETSFGYRYFTVTVTATRSGGGSFSASQDGFGVSFQLTTQVFARTFMGTPITTLVSQSTSGQQGSDISSHPAISGSGRRVAFESLSKLSDDDTQPSQPDIYIRDLVDLTTDLAAVGTDGQQGLTGSAPTDPSTGSYSADTEPALDRLGNRLAFTSDANNFDPARDIALSIDDVWVRVWLPNLVVTPPGTSPDGTIDFGPVDFPGITPPPQTFTVTNKGYGVVEFVPGTLATSGAIGEFPAQALAPPVCASASTATTTRTTLGLNGLCNLRSQTFTPTSLGAKAAQVLARGTDTGLNPTDPVAPVTATQLAVLQQTVRGNLAGTATPPPVAQPSLVIAPPNLVFAPTAVGDTSPPLTFTITNNGSVGLEITGAAFAGATDFQRTGGTCVAGSLPAGTSCTIIVVFKPTAGTGSRSGTVTDTSTLNGAPGPAVTGTMTGRVLDTGATLLPNPANFGTIDIGTQSAGTTMTLTNTGQVTFSPTSFTLSGANPGDFLTVTNSCTGVTLAAGASCTLVQAFKPTAAGTRTTTLTVNTNRATISATALLTGVGKPPGNPAISVTPSPADFGTVPVGATSGTQTLTVTNTGQVTFTVTSRSLGGANPADFTVANPPSNPCLGGPQLAPLASCSLSVHTFKPLATGARSATVVVGTSIGGLVGSATLSGTGGAPAIVIEPNPMDFGDVVVPGSSNRITAIVRNTGGVQVTITGFTIGGDNPADFNVIDPGAGRCVNAVLQPGTTCTLGSFGFTPAFVGLRRAVLTVATATPGLSTSATLVGAGLPGPPIVPGPFTPIVQISPKVASLGDVVVIKGTAFPPNTPVILRWDRGIKLDRGLLTDANGSFITSVLILPRDQIDLRNILALWGGPQPATDSLMVVLPTAKPRATNPALRDDKDFFRG
jgi:hypothetical protein